jgi:hypothetical protein
METTPIRREARLQQARHRRLGRQEAIDLSSGLLRELERYLARRQRQRYHTDFDDVLETLLPGLALALQLLSGEGVELERAVLEERWPAVDPEPRYM